MRRIYAIIAIITAFLIILSAFTPLYIVTIASFIGWGVGGIICYIIADRIDKEEEMRKAVR